MKMEHTLTIEEIQKRLGKEIDTVIFDLGGVLVKFDPANGMRKMGFSEETVQVFMEKIFSGLWESFDKINCTEEYARAEFKKIMVGYEKEVDILWDRLHDITGVYDYSYDWVKGLKDQGVKCYVLSNFGSASFKKNSELYTFLELMDGGVVSYEIETIKPDARIYEELLMKYKIDCERAVFIDDRQINVDGAKAVGLNSLLFD